MASPPTNPELAQLAEHADRQHRDLEHIQLAALDAQYAYITAAWKQHQAGNITWWDLVDCYDRVRDWGIPGHLTRWRAVIPHDRIQLVRHAANAPRDPEGIWRGHTGWPLPKDAIYPPNGRHVAYALFSADGVPVLVSVTKHFRDRLKRTWNDGRHWSSWLAVPCSSRADALDAKRQLVAKYDAPTSERGDRG